MLKTKASESYVNVSTNSPFKRFCVIKNGFLAN